MEHLYSWIDRIHWRNLCHKKHQAFFKTVQGHNQSLIAMSESLLDSGFQKNKPSCYVVGQHYV